MSTTSVTPNDPTQNYPASPDQGGPVPAPSQASQPQSRLSAILGAVAKTVSTGLQGIPDTGRPSFVTGLGEGARTAQALKFKSFDDQVRLAQLHNQDLKMQNDTQAQQDAHKRAELDNRSLANSLGIDYDTIPSDGKAVMDHLTAQSAANGAASVPPGTHLSGDGETVNIPKDTQATRDGQKQMYSMLGPVLGLPSLPPSAQFVPPQLMNMMTNKLHGYAIDGKPINHADLPGAIGALKAQRDQLAQNDASPEQLKAVDNTLGIYQANLDALDKHAADLKAKDKAAELAAQNSPEALAGVKAKKQAELDVINSPANQAAAARGAAMKTEENQQAKAGGEWRPSVTADEKKKAELAENMTFNANQISSTLLRRKDLVGVVAGRYTNVKQMAGSNDPDIVSLATDIHNIAMANNGIHGMRSAEAVTNFENKLLNHFKNGPQGIAGGLKGSVDSVQTFIDNARPETYKTHSKQGGAIKAMVKQ